MEFICEAAKYTWAQYDYGSKLEENLEDLKTKMRELRTRASDVKIELNTAEVMQGKKPKGEVTLWLENVENITSQMTTIEEDYRQVGRDFSRSRVALGKLVVKKIEEVVKLKEKSRFSEGLFAHLLPEMGNIPTTELVGRTTAERNLKKIWESLMDDEARIIGVYGMGGVGKTTIMTHIHNRILQSSRIFGIAIWVTVSQDANIERLQKGIAIAIGLEFSHKDDEMRRSVELFQALKRREKFVIILDDMWKKLSLKKVGIPEGNACKVVLTTRLKNVCRSMNCQKTVQVEVLSREEAWELFKGKLGADVVLSPGIEQIAKLVTKECDGLPLGIITVASAMREKDDVREWENALEELKCSTTEIEGMNDEVFPILKFSYDRLKSESVRSCFLYCALFPEDCQIDNEDLIRYWMAEGLIDDMGDWEKKVNKGHAILNGLIDVCMLVKGNYGNKVVMHDLIRDLAIGITRKSPRFVVKAGIETRVSIGGEEFPEDADRISFMSNKIEMLSGEPNCPKLSTLLLRENPLSRNISREFFNRMNSLRVLDLSETQIEYLPASVSNLENLHELLLQGCKMLREVPSFAKLKRLRILNLSETQIEYLPASVSNLENLHALLLNGCVRLREVPSFKKLKHLRILNLSDTDIKEVPDGMECLVNLTELYVSSENFVRCDSLVLPDSIVKLKMHDCDLSSLRCLSHLQRLQTCEIWFCNGMKWLLPIRDDSTITSLPSIRKLFLTEVPNLRGLCEGVLLPRSFACLAHIYVFGCRVLENLMSLELFQHLQCLESIQINGCSKMEEVIKGGEEAMVKEEGYNNNNNNPILLPKLTGLELSNLGKLKSICKQVIICPCLNRIVIEACPGLKKSPLSLGNSSSVESGEIRGSKEWWDALEWDDPNTKTLLQPRFKEVEGRGMKRRAVEESEEVASTSRQWSSL